MNLEEYLQHLKALSFLTRFRILNLLYQSNHALSQSQIVDILEVSKSNISRHSKILHNSNLIIEWKHGKHIYYHLNPNLKPKSILSILKEFQKESVLQKDLKKLKRQTKQKTK